jgi:phenylalanyl-tRNA synthetase beta chain
VVRRARAGETLITLDGVKRDLTDEMLVIADGARPVAMAGIMGGEETEISFQTKHVLLESAYFQPQSVRRTARALGMETEASYHFERGMDPEMPPRAADRVARLIQEVAGGRVLRGIVDAYPRPAQLKPLRLRQARMSRLLGFEVAMDEAVRILDGLGFHVERLSATELAAVAPSWRVDIDGEDDLVEEVARHVGYEKIQTELPASVGAGEYLSGEAQRREVRRTLASLGFDEAITLSFVNEERNVQFQDEGAVLLPLCNPIDETRSSMRASLLPGLLESLTNNLNHGVRNVRLFEIGKTFMGQGNDRPREREQLALVATGLINEGDWKDQKDVFDFHQLKGVLEGLLDKFRVSEYSLDHARRSYLHPGRAAALVVGGEELAVFGQLHPKVAASYKYKQPVLVATVDVERLLAMKGEGIRYHPLPRFPVVVRDISFLVSVDVGYQEIREAIGALGISELVEVRLFDVYTGAHVPAGQRSLSLSLHLRAADHTLTEDEIKSLFDQVVTRLRVRCGAEIRQ